MNTELMRRVADTVEALDYRPAADGSSIPDGPRFNMQTVSFQCGAPACIAGWTVALHNGSKSIKSLSEVQELAAEYLGISPEQERSLFCPESWKTGGKADFFALPGDRNFITGRMAAAALRHFADTGTLDWTVEETP